MLTDKCLYTDQLLSGCISAVSELNWELVCNQIPAYKLSYYYLIISVEEHDVSKQHTWEYGDTTILKKDLKMF